VRKQRIIYYFIIGLAFLFCCKCTTSRGVLSDLGNGTEEYRGIQGEIRSGETELAITGTTLEIESRELRSEISEIGDGLRQLEQSIRDSQGAAEEIGAIIQRIRARPVDPHIIEEWRNSRTETGNSGVDRESETQGYDFILGGNPYLD